FTAVRTLGLAVGGLLPVVLILMAGPRLVRHGATTGVILGALSYVLQGVYPALQTLMRELGRTGLWLLVAVERIVEAAAPVGGDGRGPAHAEAWSSHPVPSPGADPAGGIRLLGHARREPHLPERRHQSGASRRGGRPAGGASARGAPWGIRGRGRRLDAVGRR